MISNTPPPIRSKVPGEPPIEPTEPNTDVPAPVAAFDIVIALPRNGIEDII